MSDQRHHRGSRRLTAADQPHLYRPRQVNFNRPKALGHHYDRTPPCDVCGGSQQLPIHPDDQTALPVAE